MYAVYIDASLGKKKTPHRSTVSLGLDPSFGFVYIVSCQFDWVQLSAMIWHHLASLGQKKDMPHSLTEFDCQPWFVVHLSTCPPRIPSLVSSTWFLASSTGSNCQPWYHLHSFNLPVSLGKKKEFDHVLLSALICRPHRYFLEGLTKFECKSKDILTL